MPTEPENDPISRDDPTLARTVAAEGGCGTSDEAVAPGKSFGVYEIVDFLGAGAMGRVYRANDTRLLREVAIKVLPEAVAEDDELLRRFTREAKSLASINHPHIAQIYSIDRVGETNFLSLELVSGQTLGERLAKGRLSRKEAIRVCRDIADGLEAAHETGVIHRDLKPDNIRLNPEGVAKILDFGLAKCIGRGWEGSIEPVMTTQPGAVLGTPLYMSPEQIGGKPVDRRTDIWAFGCLLYECLTGVRAFGGDSFSEVAGAITAKEVDLKRIPVGTPLRVRRLLERCLRKDPRERLRDVGDARLELEELLADPAGWDDGGGNGGGRSRWPMVAAVAGGIVVGGIVVGGLERGGEAEVKGKRTLSARYSIALPPPSEALVLDSPTGASPPLAISPDGRTVVFVARDLGGQRQLYRREAASVEIEVLAGTEDADFALFSQNGEALVFSDHGTKDLSGIGSDGSISKLLRHSAAIQGATWGTEDTIYYSGPSQGIIGYSLVHDVSEVLTTPGEGELDHRWPQALPDGRGVLFTALYENQRFQPSLLALPSGESKPIAGVQGTFARFLPAADGAVDDGFLIYADPDGQNLWAVRLDLEDGETRGTPARVVTGVHISQFGTPHYAIASSGVLVYEPTRPPSPGRELVWVDREGKPQLLGEDKGFEFPRIFGEQSKVLFAHHTDKGFHEVWAVDYFGARPFSEKIVSMPGNWIQPIWSPDGTGVIISDFDNLWIQQPLSAPPRLLLDRPGWQLQHQWRADGRVLFMEVVQEGEWNLLELEIANGEVRELLATPSIETAGEISPSGKWLVYVSDDVGSTEIVLRRYESEGALGPRRTIAKGTEPVWSKDGSELFFRRGSGLFSVKISDDDGRPLGKPEELFSEPYVRGFNNVPNYDVSEDGERFVMVSGGWGLTRGRLEVHLRFRQELEMALPREVE